MKKIIAAFDGLKFSDAPVLFAIDLAKQGGAVLEGLSLEDSSYRSFKFYDIIDEKKGVSESKMKALMEKDKNTREMAVNRFRKLCEDKKFPFVIKRDKNAAIQELLHESMYADAILIDSTDTFTHYNEEVPTRFIRDLLGDAECPVLLVPGKYKPIKKIVILYDGSPSSIHAAKMLGYLFPSLSNLPVEIITANKKSKTLPGGNLVKEFMDKHFRKVSFTVLKGVPEEQIAKKLASFNLQTLVVLGGNRRGRISRWFKESMADILMEKTGLPLFIAP